ncbi:dTDP-4-dehydrorhamnose reductase [Magnetococcales bacterium HHB-1]
MKVLITGADGQLGYELKATQPSPIDAYFFTKKTLDVTLADQVDQVVRRVTPSVIINAAAYTAVDRAESEREQAFAVNAEGPAHLMRAAIKYDARLIHISTDMVFDGQASTPILPETATAPLNVYGESKASGEKEVMRLSHGEALILRTSWVYANHGHNFVKTILRLLKERERIHVVDDQVGTPTWAKSLARGIWHMLSTKQTLKSIHHWSDAGVASWYDFAVAIKEEALTLGRLKQAGEVYPIASKEYPLIAERPAFAVMDKTSTWKTLNWSPEHWRVALRQMLKNGRI